MFKVKMSGLKELQRELEKLKREAQALNGTHSVEQLRQKLKRLGVKNSDEESFLAGIPREGSVLDDNMIRTLARHNTAEQFEAELRKNNSQSSEEEIQAALEKFRRAQIERGTE